MTPDDDALGGPYRAVRVIRAHDDGPWPGTLVRTMEGEARVLVDAETLGADWRGWDASPDGHLLAPLDLSRRRDGHDAVLPVCPERVDEFLRRRAARLPLTSGEAVTLAVSLLRGCAELVATPEVQGEWWLDDAGRPVLATDASARRALDATATALEQVPVDAAMQRTWDTAIRAVTAERLSVPELTAAEDALFAWTAPEPLTTITLSPRGADEGSTACEPVQGGVSAPIEPASRSMWHTLIAGVDDDLADTVSRATTAVWRRLRAPASAQAMTRRRAPWLVGGAVAAALLVGGALWPSASGVASPGGAEAKPTPPSTATSGAPEGPDEQGVQSGGDDVAPTAPATGDANLVTVTAELLDARLSCGDDAACVAAVAVDPRMLSGGAIDLPATERSIALLDDFGDLAVLRVDAQDGARASQLVVIARQDEKWLLRDVHDVAQQP